MTVGRFLFIVGLLITSGKENRMDHVVYVNSKTLELEKLLAGKKTMIIRGAAGRKLPHGRVSKGDILYFIRNNAEGVVRAQGKVSDVLASDKLSKEESCRLVEDHRDALQLEPSEVQRWAGKRFLVLVSVEDVVKVTPFKIDKSSFGNMDD
jgi:hypothetical protein